MSRGHSYEEQVAWNAKRYVLAGSQMRLLHDEEEAVRAERDAFVCVSCPARPVLGLLACSASGGNSRCSVSCLLGPDVTCPHLLPRLLLTCPPPLQGLGQVKAKMTPFYISDICSGVGRRHPPIYPSNGLSVGDDRAG